MAALEWSDALVLELPLMDDTHREFVDLLDVVQQADDASLPAHWQALIDHTDTHFSREDAWMAATGFAPQNCHATQHAVVLKVLREGAEQGDLSVIRQMAHELTLWFPHHAQTMDASLALHMKSMAYNPVTGELAQPDQWPAQPISGCGGACSSHDEDETASTSVTA
jgi:hemerythrin-like metal-binding protein